MASQTITAVPLVFIDPIDDDDDDDKVISVKVLDEKYDQLSQLDTSWKLHSNNEYDADDEVEREIVIKGL
jgi:inorganic pyrophosphatase